MTAVLDEETRDIKNLITYKYCLNNQTRDSNKHFSEVAILLYKIVDGRHTLPVPDSGSTENMNL